MKSGTLPEDTPFDDIELQKLPLPYGAEPNVPVDFRDSNHPHNGDINRHITSVTAEAPLRKLLPWLLMGFIILIAAIAGAGVTGAKIGKGISNKHSNTAIAVTSWAVATQTTRVPLIYIPEAATRSIMATWPTMNHDNDCLRYSLLGTNKDCKMFCASGSCAYFDKPMTDDSVVKWSCLICNVDPSTPDNRRKCPIKRLFSTERECNEKCWSKDDIKGTCGPEIGVWSCRQCKT